MLKHLRITNIILVESAEIPFEAGFNVLSGETGSGKSAILHALALIAGERAEATLVRHGTDKGIVEAAFEIDALPALLHLLEESGISHQAGEELIIRREISATTGKSRAFVNNQQTQQALLKQVCAHLLEIVGQHINQRLLSVDSHRSMLDLFGSLESAAAEVRKSWRQEQALTQRLKELTEGEAQRLRDIEICEFELGELQNARLKEDEEEQLFAEYTLLANAEELTTKVHEVLQGLSGERQALPLLMRSKHSLEQLARIDTSLAPVASAYESACIELQEIAQTLRHYASRVECNPARLDEVNNRLSLINRLKKKYGATIADMQAFQTQIEEKLHRLQHVDSEIEELKSAQKIAAEQTNYLCLQLSEHRKEAARHLNKAMTKELRALNMPKASFECRMTSQARGVHGDDHIEFFFSPNVGERQISIKECASGGELSRIMLALQGLLAGKERIPTLIFDEIDANIGGETAIVVGEKLKKIGLQHQVLCITHFPQVAKQADHHLQISKQEKGGRTLTFIKSLEANSRENELARMAGSTQR